MTDPADPEPSSAAEPEPPVDAAATPLPAGRKPGPWSWVLLAAVVVFVGLALARNWEAVQEDLALLSWGDLALSSIAAAAASLAFALAWRVLLVGLGEHVPLRPAGSIFFVGQLGKYIPGSVWTAAVQAELGRQRGIRRSTMVVSYVLALLTSVVAGSLVGALVLFGAAGTDQLQAVLLVVSAAALITIPLVRPHLVSRALAWVASKAGRTIPPVDVPGRHLAGAAAFSLLGWFAFGLHLWVIIRPLGADAGDLPAATGAFALAFVAGLLVVPLPAGAGVREGILIATLTPIVGASAALTASLLSRFLLAVVDLLLAAAFGVPEAVRRLRRDS